MDKTKSKYKAEKIVIDGIKFGSKAEGDYYIELRDSKKAGRIADFELQPKFTLQEKFKHRTEGNIRAIVYIADFRVIPNDRDEYIVDVKGTASPSALIKRKMFLKFFPYHDLFWVVKSKKHSKNGWIDYFELQKIRKANKKLKGK